MTVQYQHGPTDEDDDGDNHVIMTVDSGIGNR